jgi:hypothetical protein
MSVEITIAKFPHEHGTRDKGGDIGQGTIDNRL